MEKRSSQVLTITGRAATEMTGVEDVECFSGDMAVVKTDLGEVTITGAGLKVALLDIAGGRLTLEGRVDALEYGAKAKSGKIWSRLFK